MIHNIGINYTLTAITTAGDAFLRKDKEIRRSATETAAVVSRSEKQQRSESEKSTAAFKLEGRSVREVGDAALGIVPKLNLSARAHRQSARASMENVAAKKAEGAALDETGDEALGMAVKMRAAGLAAGGAGRNIDQLTTKLGGGGGGGRGLHQAMFNANNSFRFFANTISILKIPAVISAVGFLVQAVSALAAGAVALVASLASASAAAISFASALAPATGALLAYPAILGTVAQSLLTVTLAFGGLKEAMKEQQTGVSAYSQATLAAAGATQGYESALKAQQQALIQSGAGSEEFKQATLGVAQAQMQAKEAEKALADQRRRNYAEVRAFAQFLDQEATPKLIELQRSAAKGLLPGLTTGLRELMTGPLFDTIREGIGRTGAVLGQQAAEGAAQFNKPGFVRDVRAIMDANADATKGFASGLTSLAKAAVGLLSAATPMIRWFGRLAQQFGEWAENSVKAGRETGRLQAWLRRSQETLTTLGHIIVNVGTALLNTFAAGRKQGESMLEGIESITLKWREWTESVTGRNRLDRFFERSGRNAAIWGRMMKDFFIALVNIFKLSSDAGTTLATDLADAATGFRRFTETVKGRQTIREFFDNAIPPLRAMGRLISALTRAFLRLGQDPGLARFIDLITTRVVPALERLVTETNKAFGPALAETLTSIVDLIASLAGASGPLTTFVKTIGFLVDALNRLIEVVPGLRQAIFTIVGSLAVLKAVRVFGGVGGSLLGLGALGGRRGAAGAGAAAAGRGGLLGALGGGIFGIGRGGTAVPGGVPPAAGPGSRMFPRMQGAPGGIFGRIPRPGPLGAAAIGVGLAGGAAQVGAGGAAARIGGGIASGAVVGAMVGSAVPGLGTAIGALAGSAIGAGFALKGLRDAAEAADKAQREHVTETGKNIRLLQERAGELRLGVRDARLQLPAAEQQREAAVQRLGQLRKAGAPQFEIEAATLDVKISQAGVADAQRTLRQLERQLRGVQRTAERKITIGLKESWQDFMKTFIEGKSVYDKAWEGIFGGGGEQEFSQMGLAKLISGVREWEETAGKDAPAASRRWAAAVREVAVEAERAGRSLTQQEFDVEVEAKLNDADFKRRMQVLLQPRNLQVQIEALLSFKGTRGGTGGGMGINLPQQRRLVGLQAQKAAEDFEKQLVGLESVLSEKELTKGFKDDIAAVNKIVNLIQTRLKKVKDPAARTELNNLLKSYMDRREGYYEAIATNRADDRATAAAAAAEAQEAEELARAQARARALAVPVFKKGQIRKMTLEQIGAQTKRLQGLIREAREDGVTGEERINIARWRRALGLLGTRMGKLLNRQAELLEKLLENIERQEAAMAAWFAQIGGEGGAAEAVIARFAARQRIQAQERFQRRQRALLGQEGIPREQRRGIARAITASETQEAEARAALAVANRTRQQAMEERRMRRLEIQQRITGTFDTPGGRAQRAALIQATIAPMQAQIAAWQEDQRKLREGGLTPEERAMNESLAQLIADKTIDIEERQAEALELIRQNTDQIEKNTGSLSFEFQGQRFTDMVGMGLGAGA